MNKQIFILNNSNNMLSKKYINNLILEINKFDINKTMKKLLLVASTNLLSFTKTSKGLIYQLESYKKNCKISPSRTKSKYLNNIINDLHQLSTDDFIEAIDKLIIFLDANNVSINI